MAWLEVWRRNRRAVVLVVLAGVGFAAVPRLASIGDPPTTVRPNADDVALIGHSTAPGATAWTAWPQASHDAQHSGASIVEGPTTGHIRWTRDLGAPITPGPVVGLDGTIYAATNAGVLFALDPGTGRTKWRVSGGSSYGSDLSTSPAVLPNGSILWPGPRSQLLLVTPTGDVSWRMQLTGLVMSPAVNWDGAVAVATDLGQVTVLDASSLQPKVRWQLELHEASYGSPTLSADGSTVYQSTLTGAVAIREDEIMWRSTAPADLVEVSTTVAPDGTVIIGSNDSFEYALDPTDGHTRWRYNRNTGTYSSPIATADGLVYFGDDTAVLTALDVVTGEPVFRFQGSRQQRYPRGLGFWTAPVVDSAHRVYGGTRQGLIYGVAPDGTQLFRIDTGETVDSYPALTADGALVVGDSRGVLRYVRD